MPYKISKQAVWVDRLINDTLPVKHFHIVFTVPVSTKPTYHPLILPFFITLFFDSYHFGVEYHKYVKIALVFICNTIRNASQKITNPYILNGKCILRYLYPLPFGHSVSSSFAILTSRHLSAVHIC
jgi:hypothetical protein